MKIRHWLSIAALGVSLTLLISPGMATFLSKAEAASGPLTDYIAIGYLYDTYQAVGTQLDGTWWMAPYDRGDDPLTNDCSGPAVAYDQEADAYVVAFNHEESDLSHTIHGQRVRSQYITDTFRYDADYAFPIETDIGGNFTGHRQPNITFSGIGDEMHLVYVSRDLNVEPDPSYHWIYDRILHGTSVGARFQVRSGEADKGNPGVACLSGDCLIVWREEGVETKDILGQRVQSDGLSFDPQLEGGMIEIGPYSRDEDNAAVAYSTASDQYLVVWEYDKSSEERYKDIVVRYVEGSTGEPLASHFIASESEQETNPDVAYDPDKDRFLVVWDEYNCDPSCNYVIKGRLLYGTYPGEHPGADDSITIASEWPSYDLCDPAVAYNADDHQFLVVYLRRTGGGTASGDECAAKTYNGLRGQMLDSQTTVPNLLGPPEGFNIRSYPTGVALTPDVAWGSGAGTFLAVWERGYVSVYLPIILRNR